MSINIVSTYTADIMRPCIDSLLRKFCNQGVHFFYNQLFQQALLPTSEFNQNDNGLNVILLRLSDIFDYKQNKSSLPNSDKKKFSELVKVFHALQNKMKVPLLVFLTPILYASEEEASFYTTIEDKLLTEVGALKNITMLGTNDVMITDINQDIFNSFTDKYGHIPYSLEFNNVIATRIVRIYSLLSRKPYKVIVLDCDGTLWDGIVEEDGIDGISVDEYYKDIHQFIIDCFDKGFLICLCSKNSEISVLSVFKKHTHMVLNIDKHICTYRINWDLKSANIKSMADELNLGLDSFIFIDDNKVECAEVKAEIPELLAIELPKNKALRLRYLRNIWAFDTLTDEKDNKRTEFYQKNRLRNQLKSESTSYAQFLKKLKIKTHITKARLKDYDRVYQLSQRTNQFNLYPNTMTGIEFHNSIVSGNPTSLIIEVSDKFMDYGLVGVVVYEPINDEFVIKSFFLSCRILSRAIEYDVMKHLAHNAEIIGLNKIKILFSKTERNIPAIEFLKKISGLQVLPGNGSVVLSLEQIRNLSPLIIEAESISNSSSKKEVSFVSNDFMLEVAESILEHHYIEDNHKSDKKSDDYDSIKINLFETLTRNNIKIEEKDIPLIYLGLDSLRSVMLAGEIYRTYHVEINPLDLLHCELTINKLLKKLIETLNDSIDNDQLPDMHGVKEVTLSNAQKRLWYDEKITDGASTKNNMFVAFEITGCIDEEIMYQSFVRLIEKHDALRFTFFEKNDEPFIKVLKPEQVDFKINLLTPKDEKEKFSLIEKFKTKPFNLGEAPLFRITIMGSKTDKPVLLIAIHHIIHDGWSLNLLLKDLTLLYGTYKNGAMILPQEDVPSYIHFIYWQKKNITPELLDDQKQFWKRYLNRLQKLELTYDHAKAETDPAARCKRIKFKLDTSTTRQLKKITIKHHVTLYELLLSAFGLFLSHLSNQDDVNFITAVSGRHHAHVGHTIGFFVNLLLVRLHIHPNNTFSELLKENKKILSSLFANQDLPFTDILNIIGETANSKAHSFSQAGFIFQNYPIFGLQLNDKFCPRVYSDDDAELIYDSCDESRFGHLVCFMQEYNQNIYGMFEYNASLYTNNTIISLISSFKSLLKNIAKNIECPATEISLLSEVQKNILLYKWNQDVSLYPANVNLLTQFSWQALNNPTAIAIKHNNITWTYSELDKKSNQLARQLMKEGVGHETRVGVFLEKGAEQIIAILSILKAHGCYVPLEKELPSNRMNYILQDAHVSLLVVDNKSISHLSNDAKSSIKKLNLSEKADHLESDLPVSCDMKPNQLAYILYTSGSTGNPKGVMIEQGGILRLVKSTNYINLEPSDRIAQTSSFLFDACTLEIWGALLNGAALIIPKQKTLLDKHKLAQFLKDESISVLFMTTQLFHTYSFLAPEIFKHLKYLIVGGEVVLSEAVKNVFNQKNHPSVFINGYGPTENTTFSTTYQIRSLSEIVNPIPIGKPITGTKAFVLGKNFNLLPVGVPGKLFLGGLGLARKYVNQDALNREKFIHLFNERLYDSGDIVSWQADGNLKYIGREDNQIKINGYRIELNEIEAQLCLHHQVEQAIVLVKNQDHHRQLAAYILLKNDQSLLGVNLYHHLKTGLPNYMIPHFFYQINNVPMTSNGKVDRKKLANLSVDPISYTEYESPTDVLQEKIIAIYAQVLRIKPDTISINSEFFDLGGNSISALSLIHLLNEHFQIHINFSVLYENSSVKLLGKQISYLLSQKQGFSNVEHDNLFSQSLRVIKVGNHQKTPLIFVHPIGGTGFCYLELIKLLPDDQPCYLIQDPSIDADKILFDDMVSMANYYNDLLLQQFKAKKFILAGFSFGGMLSIEMVAQLSYKKLDACVECIIAFDTWVVSNFINLEAKEALKSSIKQQYKQVAANLKKENIDPQPWMQLYYYRLQDLGFSYVPPKVNIKIVLFKAEVQSDEFAAMNDPANYLSLHTTKPVEIYSVPGTHNSILQLPHVKHISYVITHQIIGENV